MPDYLRAYFPGRENDAKEIDLIKNAVESVDLLNGDEMKEDDDGDLLFM